MKTGLRVFFGCALLVLVIGIYLTVKQQEIVGLVSADGAADQLELFCGWQIIVMALLTITLGTVVVIKTRNRNEKEE